MQYEQDVNKCNNRKSYSQPSKKPGVTRLRHYK